MPRKTAVTISSSFDFAEETLGTGGIIEEALKRRRGQWCAGVGTGRRHCWRNLLRADNDIARRVKNRENMIAKTMFRDGHLPCQLQRVGGGLILDIRIER